MKTVKQWLETIADEEIRANALRNADPYFGIDLFESGIAIPNNKNK